MIKRLTGTCVLVLGVLAFAGSAFAGNGTGNGTGGGKPSPSNASPGNSANAPGQEKKDAAPLPAQATTTTTTALTNQSAPTEGVKPSNETAHDRYAAASSNQTKKYGNGRTAGEIAQKNGAAPTTILHGPGNSQPHKAAPCAGGHEVDVHALKGRRAGTCGGAAPRPQPTPAPAPGPSVDPRADPGQTPGKRPASDPAAQQPVSGEAAGEVASESRSDGGSEGTLAATARASLPFTGIRLWLVMVFGLLLVGTGLALREIRMGEAVVESGHDHPNRSRDASGGSAPSVGGRPGR